MHNVLNRHRWAVLALALTASGAKAQDSGIGVDLHFGNDLDPTGGMAAFSCDPEGASWLYPERKRTPTGFMYGCVPGRPDYEQAFGDWTYLAHLGVGYMQVGSDDTNAMWRRFNDYRDGFVLNADFSLQRPRDGSYVDFRASRLSGDSQYYRGVVGRAGKYRLQFFARSQPNVLSSTVESLWENPGSQNMVLKPGLTKGATTAAQVDAFMAANPETSARVVRDKQGLGFNYFINPRWTAFFNASHEQREGSRPFGGPFSFGRLVETLRPIDDNTTNLNTGARFVGNQWRMEFTYTGSFFRNGMRHFTYEMPFNTTNNSPVGLFSYEPENDYHRLSTTFTRKLASSWNGEFSLTTALTTMTQDDPLVPGLLACNGMLNATINCNNWNTPDALSRSSADMRIDNQRLAGRLVLRPVDAVTWRSTFNYLREDYKGTYFAYNPLTGQYGYIGENGAFPNVTWLPGGSNTVRVRNLPLDKETREVGTGADWRLNRANTLGATLGFTRIDRTHREFDSTQDKSLKLTWNNKTTDWLMLRLNYSFLNRTGDDYDSDPYEFLYSNDLPGFVTPATGVAPHTTTAMRKYDVGERKQNKIDAMGTFIVSPTMTLYASVRAERNDYSTDIGRQAYDTMAATLNWEWQPSASSTISAWFGYDTSKLRMSNTNDVPAGRDPSLGGTAPAQGGSAAYPDGYRWWMSDQQRNNNAGLTLQHALGRATLNLDWSYIDARGLTGWVAESANVGTGASAGLVGDFPEMTYRINSLTASIRMPLSQRLAMRLFGTWERGTILDWHYAGLDTDRTYGNMIYVDGGPVSYEASLVGVMIELKL
ncbi:MtrB/PioB family outer membrane beta-barrel protein [Stenotrophomonas sp.]|uniref:MtrB/PioB family outer membrane beta-barrel protein n=1 Tax=Stenotrophomonas sp. TaxID=69392 RepID=UPI003D6D4B08